MRMRVKLLVWGGLVLVWAGALVLGWGNVESETANPLLSLGSAQDLIPEADPDIPDSQYYLATGHLLVLVAVTAAAVLLPLAGGRLRIVAGLLTLAAGGWLGYVTYTGETADGGWSPTATYVTAGVLVLVAVLYLAGRPGPVAVGAGLVGLAGAAWNTNAAVELLLPHGRPGLGSIALTVGFLVVAAGCFAALGERPRRRR
ncbi:MAG TPA: hypothetical protein H9815_07720 [Candidatus Ruania gallistercoris]|uniref:Uncharacterized protein n=1 Tax=Candidatus Ruania gallistercoris TaxID=2838746 RepID=A0A9D2EEE8_9MICO|nr:hypothetical protein [Candidatus Ruania gallistercoris]